MTEYDRFGTPSTYGTLALNIAAIMGRRHETLAANLVNFSRLLKAAGFDITSGRVIDAGRALAAIDLSLRDDAREALRACFVSTMEQLPLFDQLFAFYWSQDSPGLDALLSQSTVEQNQARFNGRQERGLAPVTQRPSFEPDSENPAETYSAVDLLTTKDFASYTSDDVRRGRRIVRGLAPKLASALSRRRRTARSRGPVDLRRSLRHSLKHGGEVVELFRTRRRVGNLRLVALCDVSGSMDTYSRFLVQLLYVLQNELHGISTFVFSTRLNEVTHLLRNHTYDQALAQIASEVDSWSGGTSIGESLDAFERRYARRRVTSRTVILIISDGWDRGDTALLTRAMQAFHRRAYKVIWLNPLLGHAEYRPLAKGMAAALPYVDYFLPVHNIESLIRLGRTLIRLARD